MENNIYYLNKDKNVKTENGTTVEEELKKRSLVGHTHNCADLIDDKDHRFTSDSEKAKLKEQGLYTNPNKVPITHGGVSAGSTFKDETIQQVITDILYPYTKPIVDITITPNGGVYEKGSSVNITQIKVVAEPKTNPISKITAFTNQYTIVSEVINPTTENITKIYNYNIGEAVIRETDSIHIGLTEGNKVSNFLSKPFTFVYPIYYGAIGAVDNITDSLVKSKEKVITEFKDKLSKIFNGKNARLLFAYPNTFGFLSQILDCNGFDVKHVFTYKVISITCLDGSSIYYNVYISEPCTVTNHKITFIL